MSQPAAATMPDVDSRESTADRARSVILLSVFVTIVAGLVAIVPAAIFETRWSYAFVLTRWMVVFALLALPLVHQVARRRGSDWSLPWGLRTPATGLLLTVEGIVWDIVSAQLRG